MLFIDVIESTFSLKYLKSSVIMPEQISGNQFDRRLRIFSYHDLKTRTTISYYVGKGRLTRFARNQLQHTANGCQTLNFL